MATAVSLDKWKTADCKTDAFHIADQGGRFQNHESSGSDEDSKKETVQQSTTCLNIGQTRAKTVEHQTKKAQNGCWNEVERSECTEWVAPQLTKLSNPFLWSTAVKATLEASLVLYFLHVFGGLLRRHFSCNSSKQQLYDVDKTIEVSLHQAVQNESITASRVYINVWFGLSSWNFLWLINFYNQNVLLMHECFIIVCIKK